MEFPNHVLLTVTNVILSSDLRLAKVYFSAFNQKNNISTSLLVDVLDNQKKKIRYSLGKKIESKYVPDLRFVYDDEIELYDKISKILKND